MRATKIRQEENILFLKWKMYLGETYGVMIYQEDVIKVAHHIAGLTLEEADLTAACNERKDAFALMQCKK
ncbi:MAG: hypothetical protein MZV64_22145 [Ignavibacteriales bacterium]|nr:hypothetical protein [Ignavibacteriales bacterium]